MGNIAVSVIIPVYNVEPYIHECLESVIHQTLGNIEIICVDDGSMDSCPKILDDYAGRDHRIKVIHKPNSGYGHTMNTGILAANGDYIAIVESDDYIMPDMMESLYAAAQRNHVDFVKSDFDWFWGDGDNRTFERAALYADKTLYGKVLSKEKIKKLYRGYIANWTGVYRRDFIIENAIFHNETPGASYQDLGFFFQAMMKAQKGFLLDRSFYRYRQDNPGSSIASREKVFCICDEFEFIYRKLKGGTAEEFGQYLSVFQLVRMQNVKFNLNRMAAKYRFSFLKRIKEDYKLSDSLGELDLSFFEEWEKDELRKMINHAGEYVEILTKKTEELAKNTEGYKQLIIYGAGQKGSEVYEALHQYFSRYETIFYAVTDKTDQNQYKKGIEIRSIHQLSTLRESAVVVVAVTKKYKDEMMEVLKDIGFQNIVGFD